MTNMPFNIWLSKHKELMCFNLSESDVYGEHYIHKEQDRKQLIEFLEGQKQNSKEIGLHLAISDEMQAVGFNKALDTAIEHLRGEDVSS